MTKPQIKFQEYFLLLLPIFFVFHGYTQNYPLIKAKDVFLLLLTYIIVFGAFSILFFFIFRSWKKAAAFVMMVMCFHFFFGNLHGSLKAISHDAFFSKYVFILPFSFILFAGIIIYFKKTKKQFNRLTQYSNILFSVLIAIDVLQFSIRVTKDLKPSRVNGGAFSDCKRCNKPDIYFIIADEYAGRQELSSIFHFDNSPFESALRQRGFFVNDSSESNYNYTPHSMASILSMNYLKNIEGRNQSRKDRSICYHLINNNSTIDLLRLQGYNIKNLSVFMLDNNLPEAFSSFILSGKDLLTSQTFISRLNYDLRFNLVSTYKMESEMNRFANSQLKSINYLIGETQSEVRKQSDQPKFVYTHLMMPHYPYLLDKNGNRTVPEMVLEGSQVNQKGYIDYLQYANKRYLELVDYILKNSPRPPVIVLMGDHGFRHFITAVPSQYYFMNFNAVYLPSKNYKGFYRGISGVNQFRVLFNSLFNQHLSLLKDSSIFLQE
jgi:hypothetical protein